MSHEPHVNRAYQEDACEATDRGGRELRSWLRSRSPPRCPPRCSGALRMRRWATSPCTKRLCFGESAGHRHGECRGPGSHALHTADSHRPRPRGFPDDPAGVPAEPGDRAGPSHRRPRSGRAARRLRASPAVADRRLARIANMLGDNETASRNPDFAVAAWRIAVLCGPTDLTPSSVALQVTSPRPCHDRPKASWSCRPAAWAGIPHRAGHQFVTPLSANAHGRIVTRGALGVDEPLIIRILLQL